MKLLTKQKCSACDTVKQFLLDANITDVQISDCTNDLVARMRMQEAGVMTFPCLEVSNKTFIYPSETIIKYLANRENNK